MNKKQWMIVSGGQTGVDRAALVAWIDAEFAEEIFDVRKNQEAARGEVSTYGKGSEGSS